MDTFGLVVEPVSHFSILQEFDICPADLILTVLPLAMLLLMKVLPSRTL